MFTCICIMFQQHQHCYMPMACTCAWQHVSRSEGFLLPRGTPAKTPAAAAQGFTMIYQSRTAHTPNKAQANQQRFRSMLADTGALSD
jgi:hypothetical protein